MLHKLTIICNELFYHRKVCQLNAHIGFMNFIILQETDFATCMNKRQIEQALQLIKKYSAQLRYKYAGYGFDEKRINLFFMQLITKREACESTQISRQKQICTNARTSMDVYKEKLSQVMKEQYEKGESYLVSYLISIIGKLEVQLAILEQCQKQIQKTEQLQQIQTRKRELLKLKMQTSSDKLLSSSRMEEGEKKSHISSTQVESQQQQIRPMWDQLMKMKQYKQQARQMLLLNSMERISSKFYYRPPQYRNIPF